MLYELPKKSDNSEKLSLTQVKLTSLKEAGWKEKDLEVVLADNIDLVLSEEQLMVIHQESQGQEMPDITALDVDGNLYLFELKRHSGKQENLLQVIRYGQKLGTYQYSKLQKMYRTLPGNEAAELSASHQNHFAREDPLPRAEFNRKQHFIVVVAGVDRPTLNAINYWKEVGLPISASTYHVYEVEGKNLVEFHTYTPDEIDYEAPRYFIVNTNVRFLPNAYKEMLNGSKASSYYDHRGRVDDINEDDRVYLYHNRVGIIAAGKASSGYIEATYNNTDKAEHYVHLKLDFSADPVTEPTMCVSAKEIHKILGRGFNFRQAVFSLKKSVADTIDKLIAEKKKACP